MTVREVELLSSGARQLGLELDRATVDRLLTLIFELLKWNSRVNLTAITDPTDVITKHLLDSLTVAPLLSEGASLLDIGSGGGFPALPLKIVRPDLAVVSIDAVQKKILFQRHIVRLLGLEGFTAKHCRAENLASAMPHHFDYAIARAVSNLARLARLALPLLAEGGRIIAMKGPQGKDEAEHARDELSGLGVEVVELRNFRLPMGGGERELVILAREPAGT